MVVVLPANAVDADVPIAKEDVPAPIRVLTSGPVMPDAKVTSEPSLIRAGGIISPST